MPLITNELFTRASLDSLVKICGYLAVASVVYFFYCLYTVRMKFRRLKTEHGVDILPHSFLFGHLPVTIKTAIKYKMPPDAHGQIMPLLLAQEYPEIGDKGLIYMDTWPLGPPMVSVYHPDMMAQFTQENNQLKHPAMAAEFKPFSNAEDLASSDGPQWKQARAMFNPGFSAKNLMSLIPAFVEEAEIFREKLFGCAKQGDVVSLEKYTIDLTVDVIGRAVLGARLSAQQGGCRMVEAMLEQVSYLYFMLEPLKRFNPMKFYHHWRLNGIFRNEMMPYVRHAVQNYEKLEGPKTILNLAVKSYVQEVGTGATATGEVPESFLNQVVNHVKIFLFAGHDTTATTLAYSYYELSRTPEALAKMRAEHDAVLGTNPAEAGARIAAEPALLNQLTYTLAVVKETLRLYPVVGSVRIGAPGYFLTVPETGQRCPADGFMLFSCSASMQRFPAYWPEPNKFVPERWLHHEHSLDATSGSGKVDLSNKESSGNPWQPRKNSFRPWEMGPRNCIGQELASLELRLILAMTSREFDMEPAYDAGAQTFLGEVAYPVQPKGMITSHPKDGMRVRVVAR